MATRVRIRIPGDLICEIMIPKGTPLRVDMADLVAALADATGGDHPPPEDPKEEPPEEEGPPTDDEDDEPELPDDDPPIIPANGPVPWLVDANPARQFGADQGAIPFGNGQKSGKPNLIVSQCEAQFEADGSDGRIAQIKLWEPSDKVSADAVMHTPGAPWVARVADPAGSGSMVYRHRLSRDAVRYDASKKADSFRAEVGGSGDFRYEPWGTEEMCFGGVFLPDYWATDAVSSPGEWHVVFQWHDAEGGLTGNPPFAVYLRAGLVPKFNAVLRKYKSSLSPPARGNEGAASSGIGAKTGVWHWFGAHYASDAGEGYRGAKPGMFSLYHAEGDGRLDKMFDYTGRWGSPNPSRAHGWKPGFWKSGLYCASKFAGRDDREVYTRGFRQYVVRDGLTVAEAFADFKASR
jgi:hypothetical protein